MEKNWTINFKRNISVFILTLIFYSCVHTSAITSTSDKNDLAFTECKIIKIDRFENYYFIYAKGTKDGRGYKIISAMAPSITSYKQINKRKKDYRKIEVDGIYRLRLTWVSEPKEEDKKGNYMEFQRCIIRFPTVKICTETGFELYESTDISGLEVIR
ncbi:MAG: hypothetical protein ACOYBS_10760 [Flavobacterium sp.]